MFKRLYREFFYVPKYTKLPERVFKTRIGLSVVTSLACCVIFCASTFAWFTSQRTSTVAPVTTGRYWTTVTTGDGAPVTATYTCPLATNDLHTFTITADGTATTGYCALTADGWTYRTVQLAPDESITLNVRAAQGTVITFSGCWGEDVSRALRCANGTTLDLSETPHAKYTVPDGVTLEQLAEHYGVPADDILLYNGISDLTPGMEIKIPNTEVTKPFAPEPETPEETEDPTQPAEDTTESTEPTEELTEPTGETPEPTEEPEVTTEPSEEPTAEPTTEPSEEAEEPEESDEPGESTNPPEETDEPTAPTADV